MTSIYFKHLCRVLAVFSALLEFSATAQSFTFSNAAPRAIPRRASIIFIQVKNLGYGDLSCYGQTKFQTPNIDKLAAEGIRFTNYYAGDTATESQKMLAFGKKSGGEIAVAQLLKNSGYRTCLIGDWDLGDENSSEAPWKQGFDEFAGYFNPTNADNFYSDYIYKFDKYFNGHEMLYYNTGGKHGTYIPDLYSKAALNFIKNNQPDEFNHHQPFFLLLNYKIPTNGIVVPSDAPFSEEKWPQQEKNKAALISRIDGYIGQLQDQLQKIGMTNNVAIFFSSSSVSQKTAGVDPKFFHSNISTNDFRVPMIVHWPGTIPAGQANGFKWSPNDFLPTAAEIAYANSPTNIDGISILPLLTGRIGK